VNEGAQGRGLEIKVGALILASLAILVAFILLLGDFRCSEDTLLYVDVASSGNLKTGAPVKVSGVTVGKVAGIELWGGRLDPDRNRPVQVRVTLKVRPEIPAMLHEDARFFITTLGALGEKYVEVDPGSPDRPALAPGTVVNGVGPLRLEVLGEDAGTIARELAALLSENREEVRAAIRAGRELIGRVTAILDENREDLRASVRLARENLEQLSRVTASLASAAGNGEDLRRLIASSRSIAERVDRNVATLLEQVDGSLREASGLLNEGRATIAGARPKVIEILEALGRMLRAAQDGRGTIGALLSDRELYDDLIELMKDVKRNPWKLLMKP